MGTHYVGFQRQSGKASVQGTMEMAVEAVTGERVTIAGSGRTDAGAHALGQIVAFNTSSALADGVMLRALNAHLPRDIAVTSVWEAAPDFHPRHDAQRRHYRYLIWNRQVRSPFWEGRAAHIPYALDVQLMDSAARALEGTHHFDSFVPARLSGLAVRTLYRARCEREGFLISIDLQASGFMRQMVRAIVGTLVAVGARQLAESDVRDILASRRRARGGVTAPARGLYLVEVDYQSQRPSSGTETQGGTDMQPWLIDWAVKESK